LRANRFGRVATNPRRAVDGVGAGLVGAGFAGYYLVLLPDVPVGGSSATVGGHLVMGLEHLALDWLDADAAPGKARLVGRQQRLVEQTADGELVGRLLAEAGVDPNAVADAASPWGARGELANYTPLTHAAELGHLEAARLLLDAAADPARADGDGDIPLIQAAQNGHLEVLRLLLTRGAAVDAADPATGFTAFHAACYKTQPDCAEALIRAGCDVGMKAKGGVRGLEIAEAEGHPALVARLRAVAAEQLRGAGATRPAPGPMLEPTPADDGQDVGELLLIAATEGDLAAAARLLAVGADPNISHGTVAQCTALCMASAHGHLDVARLLLDGGADPSRAAGDGFTPLLGAALKGHPEVLQLLLARGAAMDAVQPDSVFTAFHAACFHNQPECAEALIRAGCDVGVLSNPGPGHRGLTGREVAEVQGHTALVARLDAVGAERPVGGGQAQAPGAKKKRKKRPKKKRTGAQPSAELEPEMDPEFEGPPIYFRLQPEPEPEQMRHPEPQPEPEPEPVPLLEPEPVADPIVIVLAELGLLEHLPAFRAHEVDLGARPPTNSF
jgi:ankyrin repeat protein